jgi:hypothetical protein
MTVNISLIEKRDELKRRLNASEFKTPVDVFLAWVNSSIQKITHRPKPIPLWLIVIILSFIMGLVTFGAIFITGGLNSIRSAGAFLFESRLGYGLGLLSLISFGIFNISTLVVNNQFIGRIIVFWRDDILDNTESAASLQAFEDWLEKVCNWKLHLFVTIIVCLFNVLLPISVASGLFGELFSNGLIYGYILANLVGGAITYQTAMGILLAIMLHQYDLKLFAADPASSELIARLSGELAVYVYIISFYFTVFTVNDTAFISNQTTAAVTLVLTLWSPIIALFVLNQSALSSIIRRAKWKTLNEIQAKVVKLQASENFESKETIDAINRLLDYLERVNKTHSSALDLRAYLNFVNSLLLPLIAFLLGNIDKVMALFARKP